MQFIYESSPNIRASAQHAVSSLGGIMGVGNYSFELLKHNLKMCPFGAPSSFCGLVGTTTKAWLAKQTTSVAVFRLSNRNKPDVLFWTVSAPFGKKICEVC